MLAVNEARYKSNSESSSWYGRGRLGSPELDDNSPEKLSILTGWLVDLSTSPAQVNEEYDPIIIKATCYIAASNLIRAKEGASEEADYYYSLVTNAERTGLIDKLNDGIYKLSNEIDANDKKGKILYRSVSGTMDLVELEGEYHGEKYDLLKIEEHTTGAYGTAKFTVS